MSTHMSRKFEQEDENELRMLNRSIKWMPDSIIYASDHRHADRLIDEAGLMPHQTTVTLARQDSRRARKAKRA